MIGNDLRKQPVTSAEVAEPAGVGLTVAGWNEYVGVGVDAGEDVDAVAAGLGGVGDGGGD